MSAARLLVLSVSAGAGHTRAADALCQAAGHPRFSIPAMHLDVMQCMPGPLQRLYGDGYIRLVHRSPQLWGWLYQLSYGARPHSGLQRLRQGIEYLNSRALLRAIDAFDPSLIVCTHFLPAAIVARARRRGRLRQPLWIQVTDFDMHHLWVQQPADGWCVATDEVAHRLRQYGIDSEQIHVTGIPLMPDFGQPPEQEQARRQLGLDPQLPVLLLMGGGAGLGELERVTAALLQLPQAFQLVVLTGNNQTLLEHLRQRSEPPQRLRPLPFTPDVAPWMAAADLVISKSGGLTSSECLALGKPLLIHAPIPGQEERNADYLLEHGAALKAADSVALGYRVQQLLGDRGQLQRMSARARSLGRPHAASHILRQLQAQGCI